ncbi:rhodanese-like domain-containing protein [Ignatzschineria rhizosphaerae]|uniref:Rhodanese-like domain-containing protein n=1 Tax=Ignatzschineria rhizosphaerae TaxID=2923279 RepID=A0ABY3X535_9GAMM|nr:rhodanese-like domain-containing protein [Ignatzschineria rhizosphaerae]UNM95103.1 rhodanese-like domain-containing protein [Ignatzschineria rhizosphaerae]
MRLLQVLGFIVGLMGIGGIGFTQNITIMEIDEYLTHIQDLPKSELQLIDVRTPAEYSDGTILEAVNIDYLDPSFSESIQVLDKSKPVYLFCRSGNRSQKAAAIMAEMGFSEIYDLKEGYQAWSLFQAQEKAKEQGQ